MSFLKEVWQDWKDNAFGPDISQNDILKRQVYLACKLAEKNGEELIAGKVKQSLGTYNGSGHTLNRISGTYDALSNSYITEVKSKLMWIPTGVGDRYRVITYHSHSGSFGTSSISNQFFLYVSKIVSHNPSLLCYTDGEYIGQTDKLRRTGRGRIQWVEGTIFDGHFEDGKVKGNGTLKLSDGDKYEGIFSDIEYSNAYYVGMVAKKVLNDPILQGVGRMTYDSGLIYVGGFDQGVYSGKGQIYYTDGGRYFGEFLGGKANGPGILLYPNGAIIDAIFRNGKAHGEGVYKSQADKYYKVTWNNGLVVTKREVDFDDDELDDE